MACQQPLAWSLPTPRPFFLIDQSRAAFSIASLGSLGTITKPADAKALSIVMHLGAYPCITGSSPAFGSAKASMIISRGVIIFFRLCLGGLNRVGLSRLSRLVLTAFASSSEGIGWLPPDDTSSPRFVGHPSLPDSAGNSNLHRLTAVMPYSRFVISSTNLRSSSESRRARWMSAHHRTSHPSMMPLRMSQPASPLSRT